MINQEDVCGNWIFLYTCTFKLVSKLTWTTYISSDIVIVYRINISINITLFYHQSSPSQYLDSVTQILPSPLTTKNQQKPLNRNTNYKYQSLSYDLNENTLSQLSFDCNLIFIMNLRGTTFNCDEKHVVHVLVLERSIIQLLSKRDIK